MINLDAIINNFPFLVVGILMAIGMYTVTMKRNIIKLVIGVEIIESAVNLFLIALGYVEGAYAPIYTMAPKGAENNMVLPTPQALTLTAIVIGLAVTSLMLAIAINISQHYPALIIAIPLFAAFLSPLFKERIKALAALSIIALLATLLLVMLLAGQVYTSVAPLTYTYGSSSPGVTLPSGYTIPVRIIFEVDALSVLMALITIILALAGAIYAYASIKEESGKGKFFALLLLLTVGALGMILTGDIFNLFVFLEISSIAGAALVAYFNYRGEANEAAFKYIMVSSVGGVLVLFAIGILYSEYDLLNIAALGNTISNTGLSTLDLFALALLVAAFGMKAGTFPMHMWLPDAYGEAPPAVNPPLIASTQASLYALLRVTYIMYGGVVFNYATLGWILIVLGVFSMIFGVLMALKQNDIKRFIGYTAVSQVGYMLVPFGVGLATIGNDIAFGTYGITALQAGLFHMINDAIYMGLLFLVVGCVYHATGKKNMEELGGLARNMPLTAIFFMIGGAAISGVPPFNGFASKLMIYESVYNFNPILTIIAIAVSIITLGAYVKAFQGIFLGPKLKEFDDIPEAPNSMLVAIAVLAALVIVFGLMPSLVVKTIIAPAANALVNPYGYYAGVLGGV